MPKSSAETLEDFLHRQEASTLCAVLLELAEAHDAVKRRLIRLQLADRPDKLADGFKKTLLGWRRSTRFHGYRESREYGNMLEAWLDQVANELAPKDPPAAVALFESFIEADSAWFEHADDSDGAIGDAVRTACRHWLQAAALCESPADAWPPRLMKMFLADEYGAREELLMRVDLLLAEPALRKLVAQFESRTDAALVDPTKANARSPDVYKMSAALSLLADALGDPDVKIRAVLRYSPDPNPMQRQSFAQSYLDADRAEDALPWLQGSWGQMEDSRQSLLADALEQLGRFEDSLPIRKQMFERSPVVLYLQRWLEHLPPAGRGAAKAHARQVALNHADPVAAATLLLELGDAGAAGARMLAEPTNVDGKNYAELVPLAKNLRTQGCWLGETVVYRALLTGILERGYARAYGHGARYLMRLRDIAASGVGLAGLQLHEVFEAKIQLRHGRKSAFWAHVNGMREASHDNDNALEV